MLGIENVVELSLFTETTKCLFYFPYRITLVWIAQKKDLSIPLFGAVDRLFSIEVGEFNSDFLYITPGGYWNYLKETFVDGSKLQ